MEQDNMTREELSDFISKMPAEKKEKLVECFADGIKRHVEQMKQELSERAAFYMSCERPLCSFNEAEIKEAEAEAMEIANALNAKYNTDNYDIG